MAVKLLPKSELANLKAKETTREIQEGFKIANRIDGLRQTYSKTEQELETYRVATLEHIYGEISLLNTQKETLIGDIRQVQEKYEAMMPEISMKRTELAQFEKSLVSWDKKLDKREYEVALAELDIADAKEKSESSLQRNEDNERASRNLLIQTDGIKKEAENRLQTTRNIEERILIDHKNKEAEFLLREASIRSKEQDISNKEFEIMNIQKDLETEKIKVEDMRQTLLRSLDRIKAGRMA